MGMWIGINRKARRCYGFDEIALVPGSVTINPSEVDTSWELAGKKFKVPILAAAMDGVVSPRFAIEMGRLGGLAVLNLDGIHSFSILVELGNLAVNGKGGPHCPLRGIF